MSINILFVCTGNTCRSAIAKELFEKMDTEDLYHVDSAGISAKSGNPATDEAIQVMEEYGIDLNFHRSKMLDMNIADIADVFVTMSQTQADYLKRVFDKPVYLLGDNYKDPYGKTKEEYREFVENIKHDIFDLQFEIMEDFYEE